MIDKLLNLVTVGSTLANASLLHRFLGDLTRVIALTVITAFMTCVVLIVGCYAAFLVLVHYGLDPYIAAITVGLFILLVTLVLMWVTSVRIQQLRELHAKHASSDIPGMAHVAGIVEAFIDGLRGRPSSSSSK